MPAPRPLLLVATFGYLAFVGWLTLTPQLIASPEDNFVMRALQRLHHWGVPEVLTFERVEFMANVGLFVPIGLLFVLVTGVGNWWRAAATAVALTLVIELAQTQIPGRVPDVRDLAANGAGAALGISLTLLWMARRAPGQTTPTRCAPERTMSPQRAKS